MARNRYPEVTVNRILDAAQQLFHQKGYENTTIQDIIDALGDLSKGAIYHHFKSKEEIIIAVVDRYSESIYAAYSKIRDDKTLTGLEKIRKYILYSLESPVNLSLLKAMPNLLDNPKLFAMNLDCTIRTTIPEFIIPVVEEGVADGTIITDNPRMLSELFMVLANIWINPMMFKTTPDGFVEKLRFMDKVLSSLGMTIINDELMEKVNGFYLNLRN